MPESGFILQMPSGFGDRLRYEPPRMVVGSPKGQAPLNPLIPPSHQPRRFFIARKARTPSEIKGYSGRAEEEEQQAVGLYIHGSRFNPGAFASRPINRLHRKICPMCRGFLDVQAGCASKARLVRLVTVGKIRSIRFPGKFWTPACTSKNPLRIGWLSIAEQTKRIIAATVATRFPILAPRGSYA